MDIFTGFKEHLPEWMFYSQLPFDCFWDEGGEVCPKVGAIVGMLPKQVKTERCFGNNQSNIHVGERAHCQLPNSGLKSSEKGVSCVLSKKNQCCDCLSLNLGRYFTAIAL